MKTTYYYIIQGGEQRILRADCEEKMRAIVLAVEEATINNEDVFEVFQNKMLNGKMISHECIYSETWYKTI